MDTRFWGPDGWKLLHSIAQKYSDRPTESQRKTYSLFFNCLKYVLPCIYCRNSFTEYTNILPVDEHLENREKLTKWMYDIHNMVNDKLRKQGLNNNADPSYEEIYNRYNIYVSLLNVSDCRNMPGWDFFYSIIFNFPDNKSDIEYVRLTNYIIFFNLLAEVLPFKNAKVIYRRYIKANKITIENIDVKYLKRWFYSFEKSMYYTIKCKCMSYRDRCDRTLKYKVACGSKKDKKPTCRVSKKN